MPPSVKKETTVIKTTGKRSHAAIGRAMNTAAKRFRITIHPQSMAVAAIGDAGVAHAAPRKQSDDAYISLAAFTKKVKAKSGDVELPAGIYLLKWLRDGNVECYDVSGARVGTVSVERRERSGDAAPQPQGWPRLSGSIDWEKACVDIVWGHIGLSVCWWF